MTFPQAPSERDSRTRWLKIAAACWLLLISAVALINNVGLSRLAEQTQSSAQDAQVKALGLRVVGTSYLRRVERDADANTRRAQLDEDSAPEQPHALFRRWRWWPAKKPCW